MQVRKAGFPFRVYSRASSSRGLGVSRALFFGNRQSNTTRSQVSQALAPTCIYLHQLAPTCGKKNCTDVGDRCRQGRRRLLLPLILIVACASWVTIAAGRPNVLFLLADDQRADTIAALGNAHIQTPNLDGLVR